MDDGEGERARFTELYVRHYRPVLAYALRRVPPDQARDAVDETFLIAWRRMPDLPGAALPWLLVTARNVLREQWRRGERQNALVAAIAAVHQSMHQAGPEPGVVERLTVLQALSGLSERDREVLMLTVWDGLSNREAAVVAGCSVSSFAVRLHRARRRLASALERLDQHRVGGGQLDGAPAVPEAHVIVVCEEERR